MTGSEFDWLPWTKIRSRGQIVELSNAFLNKRVEVALPALLQLLSSPAVAAQPPLSNVQAVLRTLGFLADTEMRRNVERQTTLWRERDWALSLDYFLASRVVSFADDGDTFEVQQRSTLRGYIETDGAPPPPRGATDAARQLCVPASLDGSRLGDVLLRRAAFQSFAKRRMPQEVLSGILWHSLREVRLSRDIDARGDVRHYLVSSGSAFDFFIIVLDVERCEPGVYFYDAVNHALELIAPGEFRLLLRKGLIGQEAPLTAAATVLMTADFRRFQWRYRHERPLRNLSVEAGRIAQAIILTTAAYHWRVHMTPALQDSVIGPWLDLDPTHEQAIYALSIG